MATPNWIAPEIAAHAPKLANVAPASEPKPVTAITTTAAMLMAALTTRTFRDVPAYLAPAMEANTSINGYDASSAATPTARSEAVVGTSPPTAMMSAAAQARASTARTLAMRRAWSSGRDARCDSCGVAERADIAQSLGRRAESRRREQEPSFSLCGRAKHAHPIV